MNTVDGIIPKNKKGIKNFEDKDDTDVPTIKDGSDLAKYIIYCGQRQSPYGMPDQNITSDITKGTSTGSSIGDSIVGAIPVVGNALDIITNSKTVANYGWVSGQACVTNNGSGDDMGGEVPKWNDVKEYQRFIEDQRLAENAGLIEKSAVSAYLDSYYEKHPLDNSYEGILARRSGLTKDQVIATLDIIEVINFLSDYNPSTMYPLAHEDKKDEQISIDDKTNDDFVIIANVPYYTGTDKRLIRNFAI